MGEWSKAGHRVLVSSKGIGLIMSIIINFVVSPMVIVYLQSGQLQESSRNVGFYMTW